MQGDRDIRQSRGYLSPRALQRLEFTQMRREITKKWQPGALCCETDVHPANLNSQAQYSESFKFCWHKYPLKPCLVQGTFLPTLQTTLTFTANWFKLPVNSTVPMYTHAWLLISAEGRRGPRMLQRLCISDKPPVTGMLLVSPWGTFSVASPWNSTLPTTREETSLFQVYNLPWANTFRKGSKKE